MTNINTVALLLRDDIVTVRCAFDTQSDKEYTYVCERELAATLELGDTVVVKGNKKFMQLVEVRQVDEDCDVDTSTDWEYGWIVQRVAMENYEKNQEKTQEVAAKLKKRQREATRRQALAAMGIMNVMDLLEGKEK